MNEYIVSDDIPAEYDFSQGIGALSPISEGKAPIPYGKSYHSEIPVRMKSRVVEPTALTTVGCRVSVSIFMCIHIYMSVYIYISYHVLCICMYIFEM